MPPVDRRNGDGAAGGRAAVFSRAHPAGEPPLHLPELLRFLTPVETEALGAREDLMPTPRPRFFRSPPEFRAWLLEHHDTHTELLVGFFKVGSGRASITWPESVDEALCFGSIDGVRRSAGEEAYTIRFTPRKPTSIWSAVNVDRVEKLTREGRMHAAGTRAFARRTPERTGVYSFERAAAAVLSPKRRPCAPTGRRRPISKHHRRGTGARRSIGSSAPSARRHARAASACCSRRAPGPSPSARSSAPGARSRRAKADWAAPDVLRRPTSRRWNRESFYAASLRRWRDPRRRGQRVVGVASCRRSAFVVRGGRSQRRGLGAHASALPSALRAPCSLAWRTPRSRRGLSTRSLQGPSRAAGRAFCARRSRVCSVTIPSHRRLREPWSFASSGPVTSSQGPYASSR